MEDFEDVKLELNKEGRTIYEAFEVNRDRACRLTQGAYKDALLLEYDDSEASILNAVEGVWNDRLDNTFQEKVCATFYLGMFLMERRQKNKEEK